MKYEILGNTMPAVEVTFDAPGGVHVYTVRWNGVDVRRN